jgi:SAM-dependent methyltransferase
VLLTAGAVLHGQEAPSAWVRRWSHLIKPGSSVLDLACGHGRHTRWFDSLAHHVVAVDRSDAALASLADLSDRCELINADLEGESWPFADRKFGAVVVTNYLWRPLLAQLTACLGTGGVLLYETFAAGNETIGKPSRPDFLLQPGELLDVCKGLHIVAFEDGFEQGSESTSARFVQRIAAVSANKPEPGGPPVRYRIA